MKDVPAVDHAGGVARLMGDAVLFTRVLGRFRNEYRQAGAGIGTALDDGDLQTALRLAHTLKGAAGMIEAVPLRRQAQDLEHMLRRGGDPALALERLRNELDRVLVELDALGLALSEPIWPAVHIDAMAPANADDVVQKLAALLDEGNGDAVDLTRDAGPALAVQLGPECYLRIAQAVESFDFDGALSMLREQLDEAGAQ